MTLPWHGTTPEISSEAGSRYETPGGAQNKVDTAFDDLDTKLNLAIITGDSGPAANVARYSTPYDYIFPSLKDRLDDADTKHLNQSIYNVRDYGAVGMGEIEETAYIQNAIDAAYTNGASDVFLPPGVYLSKTIYLKNGITLRGSGMGITTIKSMNNLNDSVIVGILNTNANIADMTIDGNADNQTGGSTVIFFKCRYCSVVNVNMINNYDIAANMSNVENSLIERCLMTGTKTSAVISFSNDDPDYSFGNNRIISNICEDGALDGIIYNNNNAIITNNIFRNNGAVSGNTAGGIYSNNKRNLTISNNIIYGNDGNGIDLINCSDIIISSNISYSNNSSGIMVADVKNSTISSNICRNNGQNPATSQNDGITILNTCDAILVSGNKCYDDQVTKTQQYGIDVALDAVNLIITENNCSDNLSGGINNASANPGILVKGNLPFENNTESAGSQSFSLNAGSSAILVYDSDNMAIVEIIDRTSQVYGKFFLRGTNTGVNKLDDPTNSFEITDSGSVNAVFYNGADFVLKNKRATTTFYSYKISYLLK